MGYRILCEWTVALWSDRSAATGIEYALIVALIVVAAMAMFPAMGAWVDQVISATSDKFPS